jgi:hypothetical protein
MLFEMLVKGKIPENKFDKLYKYSESNFTGTSFLLNASDLIENAFRYEYWEISQYLELAALRSWAEYKIHDTITLDLLHVDQATFKKRNRLLTLKDGKIHFKFEKSRMEK